MNQNIPLMGQFIGLPPAMIQALATSHPNFKILAAMAKDAPALLERRRKIVREMEIQNLINRKS